MMSCKGCNNRLRLAVGTPGQCNACYLATRIERVVITRYPPAKAEELTHFLAKVLNTLEADSEAFEADKTAGVVDQNGYLVSGGQDSKSKPAAPLAAGVHPGGSHPEAGSAVVKKEKQDSEEAVTPGPTSRHRRRRREDKARSRSRSRRRDRKKPKKEPSPVPEEEVEAEPEEELDDAEDEEAVETDEKEDDDEVASHHDEVSPDTEVARDPEGAGLRKVPPKPSARKPLPRRPRTPSRSPPGYRGHRQDGPKKWKGVKHIIRGQTLGYSSKGRPPKGKGKGKWHRR